jgi:uncharacterized membrane protein
MTKKKFLETLRDELQDIDLTKQDVDEVILEYTAMIDDALEEGGTIDSFIKKMGSPSKVAEALGRDRPKKVNKVVSLMPFLATIVFFTLGVVWQAWQPGWIVFLLIPLSDIFSRKRINWFGIGFIIILATFVLVGTFYNAWAPAWSLFLLILPFKSNDNTKPFQGFAIVYTFAAVIAYQVIFTYMVYQSFGAAGVTWLSLLDPSIRFLLFTALLLLLVPVVFYAFASGAIKIYTDIKPMNISLGLLFTFEGLTILAVVIGYLAISITTGLWHPAWLIFFLIPIVIMVRESKKLPLRQITPFIATTLFVLVGEYVSLPEQVGSYALSWLFFLLIPIVNILFSKESN